MKYCVMCSTALLERTVDNQKVLLCTSCGAILTELSEGRYRYVGTTQGNQQLRELLVTIDEKEGA